MPDPNPLSSDDWLERVLVADAREHAAVPGADAGFTARVMAALPSPVPAAVPAWRKPALAALWTIALAGLALALPGTVLEVGREAYRLLAAQPVSLTQIASTLVVLGIATWGVAGYVWFQSESRPGTMAGRGSVLQQF